jgi:hypothetical protein
VHLLPYSSSSSVFWGRGRRRQQRHTHAMYVEHEQPNVKTMIARTNHTTENITAPAM